MIGDSSPYDIRMRADNCLTLTDFLRYLYIRIHFFLSVFECQEPHIDLLTSLMLESGINHVRRMCVSMVSIV